MKIFEIPGEAFPARLVPRGLFPTLLADPCLFANCFSALIVQTCLVPLAITKPLSF